ncbi:hypothetical protein CANARDRAFT_26671 [[Candida] arabinofermentans NRRL YB-2248]|uniref:rRNA biogenesis protein RRP36 n=1 Tax=[Candida] arabinofermentans NRRL YB-2248 TaxID=983967 RepID=A0A1E4T673_9ASCO|nr:hypothetical protein CANARDRAFT_26671 [[Candida] arabinofermentans NRRL YB-2248]
MSRQRPTFRRSDINSDSEDDSEFTYQNGRNIKRSKKQKKTNNRNHDEDEDEESSDDEMKKISFGALTTAQNKLRQLDQDKKKKKKKSQQYNSDSDSDSDSDSAPSEDGVGNSSSDDDEGGFFNESNTNEYKKKQTQDQKKRSKHAPTQQSIYTKPPKIREIPGLLDGTKYAYSKHKDIRFDAAFGKVNTGEVRKNYAFLDNYRTNEINEMQKTLKNDKKLDDYQREDLEYTIKSTKSRLESLKKHDFEKSVVKKYLKETGKEFVNRGEKRKLINVARFDGMKGKQREKVLERKRKKKLGKEMRELEFGRK